LFFWLLRAVERLFVRLIHPHQPSITK
jgi:hypothetical protein